MKRLNKIRKIALAFLGGAIVLEVLGAILEMNVLFAAALVILFSCIVAYLILFRCPYLWEVLGKQIRKCYQRKGRKTHLPVLQSYS